MLFSIINVFRQINHQLFRHLQGHAEVERFLLTFGERGFGIVVAKLQHQRLMTGKRPDVPASDRIEGKTVKFIHFEPDRESITLIGSQASSGYKNVSGELSLN